MTRDRYFGRNDTVTDRSTNNTMYNPDKLTDLLIVQMDNPDKLTDRSTNSTRAEHFDHPDKL